MPRKQPKVVNTPADLRAKAERWATFNYEGSSTGIYGALADFATEHVADELRALRAEIQQLYIMLDNIVAAIDLRLGVK